MWRTDLAQDDYLEFILDWLQVSFVRCARAAVGTNLHRLGVLMLLEASATCVSFLLPNEITQRSRFNSLPLKYELFMVTCYKCSRCEYVERLVICKGCKRLKFQVFANQSSTSFARQLTMKIDSIVDFCCFSHFDTRNLSSFVRLNWCKLHITFLSTIFAPFTRHYGRRTAQLINVIVGVPE